MSGYYGQTRKGISSIVGTVFSVIVLASVITYVSYSLNILDDFNQGVLAKNEETLDRGKEDFDVLSANIKNSKFNITISNTGTLPIEITKMWVQNKSTTDWVNGYDIGKSVSPDGVLTNIGKDISLYASTTNAYDIRLVTSRGNAKEFSVNSGNLEPLDLQLFVLPGTVPSGFTTTVLLTVTNNMSSNKILTNLVPTITSVGGASATLQSGPNPPKYDTLLKGDTAYFKWIYKVSGDTGQTVTFTASIQNGYPENDVSDTATLSDVIFAIQSGASVETQGITVPPTADDILVLHLETSDALNGRQMYSGSAEASGLSIDTSTATTSIFYTKNDTAVLVNDGNWNASLRYISKPLPDSIGTSADLIYHFESNDLQKTLDSSGNARDINIPTPTGTPQFGNYGQHSTKAFKFNGVDQYLYGPSTLNSHDDIKGYPDVTAGWFKAVSPQNVKSVIYRVGNNPSGEYYEISLGNGVPANNGKLYFNYTTKTPTSTPQGLCESNSSILNNGNWHHFVAYRNNDFYCKLYINGTLTLGGEDATTCTSGCSSQEAKNVDVSGPANIGRNPATAGEYFNGQIDGLFHWNSGIVLSDKNALDLFNADYGPNAHKMTFKYEETDNLGNNQQLIKQDANYVLPFHDGKANPSGWTSNVNYSTIIPDLLIDPENRLKFSFNWNSGLNMTIRIDDANLSNPKSTYIQMPNVTSSFPSYYEYKTSTFPSIKIYNKGPYSSWLTYLSRLTFDHISTNSSYASHIKDVEGQTLNTGVEKDSILLKVNQTYTMTYQKPRSIPDATNQGNTNLITSGQYRMYVFFSGYDEQGNIFLRTVYFGIVRVINDT
jgi:hypothetical protein